MSRKPVKTVGSVSEFVDAITQLNSTWGAKRLWFRGHASAAFELTPSLYRKDNRGFNEASAFNVFWARGQALPQFARLQPREYWSWYFAARHHGLPSRLLDWSENALVALFFATENPKNPRVWVLDPTRVNKLFFSDPRIQIPNDWEQGDFMSNWLPSSVGARARRFKFPRTGRSRRYSNRHPGAIFPSATNPRLIAQQGMFTVHGTDPRPLDVQMVEKAPRIQRLACIDIAQNAASRMHRDLSWLGLNKFLVDAGGDGLAAHLSEFYRKA